MGFTGIAWLSAVGLFLGMLAVSEVGRRMGLRQTRRNPEDAPRGVGLAEGAVFGLLGLVMALTFSGAAGRFHDRRDLVIQEANAIGTAYLRLALLPGDAQPELRDLFKRYLDARLATYVDTENTAATQAKIAESEAIQDQIWAKALAASQRPGVATIAGMLLLPALNEVFDIRTTRLMARENHPPLIVDILLGGLSLVGAFLVGYGMSDHKTRSWLHTVIFAAVLSFSLYVIVDLEYPRIGLIRVDAVDRVLVELRQSMD